MLEIINHPDYNQGWSNDIAIVKLAKPLEFNENVGPACLPDAYFKPKSMGWVSGWGFHEFGEWSTTLKYTYVHIFPYNECKQYMNITENMFCSFVSVDGDVCTGDAGGPLMMTGITRLKRLSVFKACARLPWPLRMP